MKDTPIERHIPIAGAHNIRDLGGYRCANGAVVPWRRFIRADSLHRVDEGGIEALLREGLRTVIDLRSPSEVAEAPNPLRHSETLEYLNLPVFDELAPAALGQGDQAHPDPLLNFYLTALHTRQSAFRDIFAAIAAAQDGTIIFNCTAGKDRTGLIAALLLETAGVARADVIADYVLTEALIPDLVAEFLELSRQRGGDVEAYAKMLQSPPETMAAALASLDESYGGARAYLRHAGLSDADLERLLDRLDHGPGTEPFT